MWATFAAHLTAMVVVIAAVGGGASAATYSNHTVGGPAGWFFDVSTNATSAKYSTWAAAQSFGLGDFLIFNTNTNQTVVQTYNSTTYDSCTADDASDSDTLVFGSGATAFGQPLTIAVPLTKVGPNYFFSDADDGEQCLHGMKFEIKVDKGSGLPPSLNRPPPPPYSAPPVAESPPVFQGTGGGQGERIRNGCDRLSGATVVVVGLLSLGFSYMV